MISLLPLVLVESGGVAERFHEVSVLARLFLPHFLFGLFQVFGIPIGPVFVDCRFELAYLLAGGIELQLSHAVDVDKVIPFLRRRIKEIHFRHLIRFQSHLQSLIGK